MVGEIVELGSEVKKNFSVGDMAALLDLVETVPAANPTKNSTATT